MTERAVPTRVGIIMGSDSDLPVMLDAARALDQLGIGWEINALSAHRTPHRVTEYVAGLEDRGLQVVVAGAGGAAHLPGVIAALTPLPVLGVPMQSQSLGGLDSLLSMVQMPAGIPVATFAIGRAGAVNAALYAAAILALADPAIAAALDNWRRAQSEAVPERPDGR